MTDSDSTPASGDVEAAWWALLDCSDDSHGDSEGADIQHHRPLIEAAIRAEAAGPSYAAVRKAVSDSYYDSRYEGATMEVAADLAATRILNLWSQARAAEYARLAEADRPKPTFNPFELDAIPDD